MPNNKVSLVKRKINCTDISCYSNKWEAFLGWKANKGPKEKQGISIQFWIKNNAKYGTACLRGLFETDGSVYYDRKYLMANFTTTIPSLAIDVMEIIKTIGFKPNLQQSMQRNGKIKYVVRISKNANEFINQLHIAKQ